MPMTVENVYTPSIVKASRGATIQEAARLMRQHHVGALIVTDEGLDRDKPVGIVTDRDLVLSALAEGLPLDTRLEQVMTQALATVLRTDPLRQALEVMRTRGVRRLAVAEPGGELAGFLSLDDVVDQLAGEVAELHGLLGNELAREIAQRPSAPA
ncbi:MAG TPA: CBS domain-containing protein [Burkholderiales bacterium]|nr:CBS domain-containing protein [Burkholderiales bacterium]